VIWTASEAKADQIDGREQPQEKPFHLRELQRQDALAEVSRVRW
jgi:hypothetical protein